MLSAIKIAGQVAIYAAIMAVIGYFSDTPAYRHFPADSALIKLALVHGGQSKGGCREPTPEDLEKLAPNMRRKLICERERLPVAVELELDGKVVFSETLEPTGLRSDGPARLYQSFPIPAGPHTLAARMRDSDRAEGFDYEAHTEVALRPGVLFVIQFRAEGGGFLFHEATD
ncbi:MAG: hypothetical protein Q8P46_12350 [Hyphomicrobiales bacterium]|nr:hypothetical protein [Hyphomicrobiales bacterium]